VTKMYFLSMENLRIAAKLAILITMLLVSGF
jgi:hypothetical protein